MTTIELKTKMHHIIDEIPEAKIAEAFDYLKSIQQQPVDKDKLRKFIDKVFEEDDALLRRLAQ